MGDELVDALFRAVEIAAPERDRDRPDQRDTERDRVLHLRGLGDGLLRQLQRVRGPTLQPEFTRQRDAGPVAMIEAVNRADSFRARRLPGDFQHLHRVAMLAGQVERDLRSEWARAVEPGSPSEPATARLCCA